MKIIILTPLPFWHPATQELIDTIRKYNISITALDVFLGIGLNENNELVNYLPLGLKGIFAKLYLKFFRSPFIKKYTKDADILDVHFVDQGYKQLLNNLPNKIICTLFGSDLFRTSDKQKKSQIALFKKANQIVLSKNMADYFVKHFPGNETKLFYSQYGSNRIAKIISEKANLSKNELRKHFSIPEGKITITCGYNNKPEQQHLLIIKELTLLNKKDKSKIILLFPMTYGDVEKSYIKKVEEAVRKSGIDFKLFLERFTEDDLVKMRLVSDVTINTQTTDALASSIKEAMVAGDIMLIGEWLPYDIYSELGVFYRKIQFSNLRTSIEETIENFDDLIAKSAVNETLIKNCATWEVLIQNWINLYTKTYSECKQ